MKTLLLLSTVGLTLAGGAAWAADLPSYAPAPAPLITEYSWTGLYFGAHVGGGFQTTNFQDPSALTNITICCDLIGSLLPSSPSASGNGQSVFGGIHAGVNYQIGRLVVGTDYDFSGMSLNTTGVGTIPGATVAADTVTERFSARTDWTAASTLKVGLARDRFMLYSKIGVAWANEHYSLGVSAPGQSGFGGSRPFNFQSSASGIRVGWTVGTGVEWAFADNWSAKVEYDYMDFASKAINFGGAINGAVGAGGPAGAPATFNTNNNLGISEVKFGIDYKFSQGTLF